MTDLTTFQNAEVFGISIVACVTIAVLLVTHPRGLTWMKNHDAEDVKRMAREFIAPHGRHAARPLWIRVFAVAVYPIRIALRFAAHLAERAGLITSDAAPATREVSQ